MKILDVNSIRLADAFTIEHEPISSINLMERASNACAQYILSNFKQRNEISIFVGPGNNGGDGLAIARLLRNSFNNVLVYIIEIGSNFSPDFIINLDRIQGISNIKISNLKSKKDFPQTINSEIIIDAIFGSGLNRSVEGFVGEIIDFINSNSGLKISIDIPSGLFADRLTEKGKIIYANLTLSLEFPKFTMLLPDTSNYIGELQIIPIGLHPEFISNIKPKSVLLEDSLIAGLLQTRQKFTHKGMAGHALLIAGSGTKPGAAVLSSGACLRSGVGLLTVHQPESATIALKTNLPEAMLSIDENNDAFSNLPDLSPYNAIAIGPGLGTEIQSAKAFKLLIQNFQQPIIIDADALNILSENKTWLSFLTPGTILTPHPKEFDRIAGKSSNSLERIEKQIEMSKRFNLFIILKGAHTSISCPDGSHYFNNTGNPGMATAGSGDVLTGVVLGLLAQGYSAHDASVLGVYIHGLAGDFALETESIESLIASDLIKNLGNSFNYLRNKL